ncbi:MAG TPA: PIN domain-containing protein, partial [Solirubrobacterales bacterium]|nr:PIN domain-containing protein [Solirubrobacterales bacterium]
SMGRSGMKAILNTSVLIAQHPLPLEVEAGISTVSLAELHFGVLKTKDPVERARRAAHLGRVESAFETHPLDERVARALGQLQATVSSRGGDPRRRTADLAIAATAMWHEAVLLTRNYKDFKIVDDLVDVREPPS